MTHGLEIDALQHTEHLQQHRTLAPGAARVHVGAGEARPHRRLHGDAKLGHILLRHQAAVGLVVGHDGARDVATIKGIPRGFQPGGAAVRRRSLLLIRHVL